MHIESQTDLEFEAVEPKLTGAQRADLATLDEMFADLEAEFVAVEIVAKFADEAWSPKTNLSVPADPASLDRALADFDLFADDERLNALGLNQPLEEVQPFVMPQFMRLKVDANEVVHQALIAERTETWRVIDRWRRGKGKGRYLAKKRGMRAGKIMREQQRRPRPWGQPDGPAKQDKRREQNRQAQVTRREKMTDDERIAEKEKNTLAKQASRKAKEKAKLKEAADLMEARNIV